MISPNMGTMLVYIFIDCEIAKDKLKKIQQEGIKRKLMGVKIDHNKIDMYCEKTLLDDNNSHLDRLSFKIVPAISSSE